MSEKPKASVRIKTTPEQEEAQREIERMNNELQEHHKDTPVAQDYTPFVEQSAPYEVEVLDKEEPTIRLTPDDLAKIVAAAQGDYEPFTRRELPPDATFGEKVADFTDEAVGEVGRGAHRIIDGCRDILAGAVDIVTLGRARRR